MNNEIDDKVYIPLTPFKGWVLENFPFIEADFDAITNYELICKITEYLNNVINNQNEVQDLASELVTGYNNLLNYVNDEINNKLDEMAEDGSLTNLIKNYVDPIINTFENNVTDQLESFDNRLSAVASGSPIPVASTSSMTDTSRVYVNTTDGKWYYYDGDSWEIGGTYQATGIGENTVSYNELSKLLENKLYKTITADDILWLQNYNVYQGNIVSGANIVTSRAFLMPKGGTIAINSDFDARITWYDLNRVYVNNTGSFASQTNWVAPIDCYVRISMYNHEDATQTQLSDANSTNVVFKGLLPLNQISSIIDDIKFTSLSAKRVKTSPIFVGKGTKIRLADNDFKYNSGQSNSATLELFDVRKAGETKNLTSRDYGTTQVTIDEDCFVEIGVRLAGSPDISSDDFEKIRNGLEIEYVNCNKTKLNIVIYTGNNSKVELIDHYSGTLSALKLNGDLVIYNGNKNHVISWSDIKTQFSSNVVTIDNEEYLSISNYRMFYFDLDDNDLHYEQYNGASLNLKTNIVPLLMTGYNNFIGGELLNIFIRQNSFNYVDTNLSNLFNSTLYPDYNWKTKAQAYTDELANLNTNIETFVFFTDPHLMGSANALNETTLQSYISKLQKMYNSIPVNFIVGGGDWLNNDDTPTYARQKLGYVDGFMNSMFKNYYGILGNHDSNYQGKLTTESERYTGILSLDNVINLMYRKYGKCYYKFDGVKSKNYVLDTGLDTTLSSVWDLGMNDYKWTQIGWLANELIDDDPIHATVMMHMIWKTYTNLDVTAFTDNVTKLIEAYNDHTTINLNSVTYDFTNCEGHVDYVLGGHLHIDYNATINNVLCIGTLNFTNGNVPSYDIVINDYENSKVKLIRVGTGSDREFNI